jgi:hypothetical protein
LFTNLSLREKEVKKSFLVVISDILSYFIQFSLFPKIQGAADSLATSPLPPPMRPGLQRGLFLAGFRSKIACSIIPVFS